MKRYIVILIIIGALIVLTAKKVKASPVVQARVEQFRPLAERWGRAFSLDPDFLLSEICVESAGDPLAVSSDDARGLMQILPSTLPDINRMIGASYAVEDLFQPEIAVQCGAVYLHWLLGQFGGDLSLAVRAYFEGIGNIRKDPSQGQGYLDKVSAYYSLYTGGGLA